MGMIEQRVVDLVEVYMELIRVDLQMKAAREHVADHIAFRAKLIRREQEGGVRSDTFLIDGRLSLAENTLATINLDRDNAIARYTRLTGKAPGNLTKPGIPALKDFEKIDLANNWDYLAACATLKSFEAALAAVQKNYGPNVFLDAGATEGDDNSELHALVGISLDLYKGGERKASECREYWQTVKARELLRAADENRRHRATDLLNEKQASASSVVSLDKYLDRLSSVASDYERQFNLGKRELLNLLDIRNEKYQAKSRLIDARFNDDMSNFRILGTQGKLVYHLIGDEISRHVGMGCGQADDWYCDIKNNLATVSCDCNKESNTANQKRLDPIVCDPVVATAVKVSETNAIRAVPVKNKPLQKLFSKWNQGKSTKPSRRFGGRKNH
jgi:adhesin transport system outer membrane protein